MEVALTSDRQGMGDRQQGGGGEQAGDGGAHGRVCVVEGWRRRMWGYGEVGDLVPVQCSK